MFVAPACLALILVVSVSVSAVPSDGGGQVLDRHQKKEMNEKWREVSDESFQHNQKIERFQAPVTSLSNKEVRPLRRRRVSATGELPLLTGTLLAWITTQTENIVEELEAIARYNSQADNLSIKNYVRYLAIYRELGVIAEENIQELMWVKKKYKIFGKVCESAEHVVDAWLHNRETELRKEEQIELENETKKRTRGDGTPSKKWTQLYDDIRYIANQQSLSPELTKTAQQMLAKSPLGEDRKRSMRYMAATRPVNK